VNSRIGASFAMSRIKLNDNLSVAIFELKNKIRQNFPEYAIAKPSFEWAPDKDKLVKMTLTGRSTERLIDLSQTVIAQLDNVNGFAEVGIDNGADKSELQLLINRQQVSRLGLSTQEVANRIAVALRGTNLRSFRDQKLGEVAIRVVYYSGNSVPLDQIKQLPILEYQGKTITLQQLVKITSAPVMKRISRVQRRTNLTISINLDDINRKQAAEKINQVMDYISLPSGYTWQLGRQFQRDEQAMNDMLINMMLALALIFMVMAALFESLLMPIAILSSIGLAFIGVYWAFAILGIGLGDTGMIGMLILMGIVVNNGIVLIDQINQRKGQAEQLLVPIIDACVSRIRPILMTVATTVIGMLPLAFASTDNQTYPIAVAIIGGLIFSTFTSLFLVPYCYLMLVKLGERTAKRFAIAKRFADRLVKT
jgi:HAE1 family hydrophobic/amphiphilic exporter-1